MKKTYIVPALEITKLDVEAMIATSGPKIDDGSANQDDGMDVKGNGGLDFEW